MDNTPDTAFPVFLEHTADLILLGEVTRMAVDFRALLVLLRGVGRQRISRNLCNSRERLRVRVVEVVDGYDLVSARRL